MVVTDKYGHPIGDPIADGAKVHDGAYGWTLYTLKGKVIGGTLRGWSNEWFWAYRLIINHSKYVGWMLCGGEYTPSQFNKKLYSGQVGFAQMSTSMIYPPYHGKPANWNGMIWRY